MPVLNSDDLGAVSTEQLHDMRRAVQAEVVRREGAAVVDVVAASLAEDEFPDGATPVKAWLTTDEWDNGYFFRLSGNVDLSDGSRISFDLDDENEQVLADFSSNYALGRRTLAVIDLAKRTVEVT